MLFNCLRSIFSFLVLKNRGLSCVKLMSDCTEKFYDYPRMLKFLLLIRKNILPLPLKNCKLSI